MILSISIQHQTITKIAIETAKQEKKIIRVNGHSVPYQLLVKKGGITHFFEEYCFNNL